MCKCTASGKQGAHDIAFMEALDLGLASQRHSCADPDPVRSASMTAIDRTRAGCCSVHSCTLDDPRAFPSAASLSVFPSTGAAWEPAALHLPCLPELSACPAAARMCPSHHAPLQGQRENLGYAKQKASDKLGDVEVRVGQKAGRRACGGRAQRPVPAPQFAL